MSFDRIAPHYRWMETVLAGEKLQGCRTRFLEQIPHPQKILILGEGPGRSLLEYCCRFPDAQITCIDSSAAMIEQARRRLEKERLDTRQVTFLHADALQGEFPADDYNLIVTNFFLDCFTHHQLSRLVNRIASSAHSKAHWLLADFQEASGGLRRLRSRLILRAMYSFFRIATQLPANQLVRPDPYLQAAGFQLQQREESEWGLLRSDWWRRVSAFPDEPVFPACFEASVR